MKLHFFFCLATKEAKMPDARSLGDLLVFCCRKSKNSLRSDSFDFYASCKQQVPACAINARGHGERFEVIEHTDSAWNVNPKILKNVLGKIFGAA